VVGKQDQIRTVPDGAVDHGPDEPIDVGVVVLDPLLKAFSILRRNPIQRGRGEGRQEMQDLIGSLDVEQEEIGARAVVEREPCAAHDRRRPYDVSSIDDRIGTLTHVFVPRGGLLLGDIQKQPQRPSIEGSLHLALGLFQDHGHPGRKNGRG